jgi:hypothetical protein
MSLTYYDTDDGLSHFRILLLWDEIQRALVDNRTLNMNAISVHSAFMSGDHHSRLVFCVR